MQNNRIATNRKSDISELSKTTLSKYRILGGWFLTYVILTCLNTCRNLSSYFRIFGVLNESKDAISADDSIFIFIILFLSLCDIVLAFMHIWYMIKRKYKPFLYTYLASLAFFILGIILNIYIENQILWDIIFYVIEFFIVLMYFYRSNRIKIYFLSRKEYRELYCAAPRYSNLSEDEDEDENEDEDEFGTPDSDNEFDMSDSETEDIADNP